MRKKKLVIISVILSVFAVMLILASTVFMLGSVSIDIVSANNSVINKYDKNEIIKSGKFNYGGNVLFMNFDKQTARIEAEYSYVKIEKIERKFPNKVIVHISERTPAAYVKSNGFIYVLDKDFKVLNVVLEANFDSSNESLPESALLVPEINATIGEGIGKGSIVKDKEYMSIVQSIILGLKKSNKSITNLSSISVDFDSEEISIETHNRNLVLILKGFDNLAAKMQTGIQKYYEATDSNGVFEESEVDWEIFTQH